MKMRRRIKSTIISVLLAVAATAAGTLDVHAADTTAAADSTAAVIGRRIDTGSSDIVNRKVEKLRDDADSLLLSQRVIVGNDTVKLIIPEKNYGRYDRGLFNFLYIPKGQWSFGVTAFYGSFDTEDVSLLSFMKDLNFKGSMFSLSPYVSYFVGHNRAIGMKLGYTRNKFDLKSLSVDIDDDINFTLKDVDYHTENYTAAIFYRRYIGLDNSRRFAIFNDTELAFSNGSGTFKRLINNAPRETRTNSTKASLNFSPGLCVFIQEYVSFSISFGVFGVYYKTEKQRTNDVEEGSRSALGASFKFNLLNLNMGIAVHI